MNEFKLCMNGNFAITRPYSIENPEGFIAGGISRQYVLRDNLPLPFIQPASFPKVEALKLIKKLNSELSEFEDITTGEIDLFLWKEA